MKSQDIIQMVAFTACPIGGFLVVANLIVTFPAFLAYLGVGLLVLSGISGLIWCVRQSRVEKAEKAKQ